MPTIEINLTCEEDIGWKAFMGKFYLVLLSEKKVYFICYCAVGELFEMQFWSKEECVTLLHQQFLCQQQCHKSENGLTEFYSLNRPCGLNIPLDCRLYNRLSCTNDEGV